MIRRRNLNMLSGWAIYRKTRPVRATRINGPFTVETREGVLGCRDGYVAVDSGGWPYPIDKEEFDRIYEKVT